MASDVSQRARDCTREIAHILAPYSAPELEMILRMVARFEAEIRAETTLPPILIDPTGKGYPTDERPMTVAEFEAVIRADATAIERERCALVADIYYSRNAEKHWRDVASDISAAIRKGPTP